MKCFLLKESITDLRVYYYPVLKSLYLQEIISDYCEILLIYNF
jgi:hypothetical protein